MVELAIVPFLLWFRPTVAASIAYGAIITSLNMAFHWPITSLIDGAAASDGRSAPRSRWRRPLSREALDWVVCAGMVAVVLVEQGPTAYAAVWSCGWIGGTAFAVTRRRRTRRALERLPASR